jgi:hypothetical protein
MALKPLHSLDHYCGYKGMKRLESFGRKGNYLDNLKGCASVPDVGSAGYVRCYSDGGSNAQISFATRLALIMQGLVLVKSSKLQEVILFGALRLLARRRYSPIASICDLLAGRLPVLTVRYSKGIE